MQNLFTPVARIKSTVLRGMLSLIVAASCTTSAFAQNITISGTVYDDGNGGTINGTVISAVNTNQLYVYLLDNSSPTQVINKATVAANGTYSLTAAANTGYNVTLSSSNVSVNTTSPTLGLPIDYVPTAEGTTSVGDGFPDYGVAINSSTNLTINYAIDKRPVGNNYTISTPDFDVDGKIIIPARAFTATDAEDGNFEQGFFRRKVDLYQASGGVLYYKDSQINFSSANTATRIQSFDINLLRFQYAAGLVHKFSFSITDSAGTPQLVPNDINILFPLPIKLTSFTGAADATGNMLQWQTATETGNSRFDIERSEDGAHFTTVGTVGSLAEGGSSTQPLSYEYHDLAADAHQSFFYRIKQTDLDEQSTYSRTIRITGRYAATGMQLATYPNPSTGNLSLDMATGSNNDETLYITLLNTSGNVVLTRSFEAKGGRISTALDISAFPAGTYYVQLKSNSAPAQAQQIVLLQH